jgi:hypothetical protein
MEGTVERVKGGASQALEELARPFFRSADQIIIYRASG